MNYRHAYHAGNFADVAKHLALVSILTHLKKKEAGFAVLDTHSGRGVYDLSSDEATRGAEAASGIARLGTVDGGPETLRSYLALARGPRYPGSPLIAAQLLRVQDRLVAVEKHREDLRALKAALAPFARARAEEGDGYARLAALLPPPERRGLTLIDPSYEAPDEFGRAARAVGTALTRFATGIVMVWFPVKSKPAADAFVGEALAFGAAKALRLDIALERPTQRLSRAGLLVVNPPYGFAADMEEVLGRVAPLMDARPEIDWLAGGE